jgi:cation diffusion facilitator family transporter
MAAVASLGERKTRVVVAISAVMMVAELVGGWLSGSMALAADGWHMGTHVGAMGLAWVAYWYGRRAQGAGRLVFGPGKVYALAGYTNALALAAAAIFMAIESVDRLISPQPIAFAEALPVAVAGLAVNLVSARILHAGHDHRHDHNLRSVYLHVVADILTSVLAIGALAAGELAGIRVLDPLMGVLGAGVILVWAYGLWKETAGELVDAASMSDLKSSVVARLESDPQVAVQDVRVWSLGGGALGCIARVRASAPRSPAGLRQEILGVAALAEVAVEVHAEPQVGDQPAR